MDMRHLRYFIAIAEEGSLSKAAERLNVAQPALSQHMRNIEEDLKVTLLFRSSRGVQLTEAGKRLLEHGRLVVESFEQLFDIVGGTEVELSGEVRFGLPGTVSQVLSARLIDEASRRYPKIRLRIAEAMSGFIFDWLREGKVDIAVLYRARETRGLALTPVLSEELRLFAAPGMAVGNRRPGADAVRYADAIALPLIVPSPGHGLRDLLDEMALSHCETPLNARTEIDSYAPIKTLVEQGLGYSILPAMAIKAETEAGRLVSWRICEPDLRRQLLVATPADRPMSSATKAIENLTMEMLSRLVGEGVWDARFLGAVKAPAGS
ncbi:LysR substrate-binding domain-containing protein [Aliihoeflea sp. 2WW]|uniref:LysR substrate-binding domain-containing protein n=1 Tax=Aliihoeflea sp. 2WW TaxID=1381123 RepID=UPI00046686E3|nr:LysR substrate-binding domain-containing protein [Aliihoeflea sp. 2WW]